MYTSLLSYTHKIVIHRAYTDPSLHMFSHCFLVNKSAFRYIVLFGNCMDPPELTGRILDVSLLKFLFRFLQPFITKMAISLYKICREWRF